MTRDYWLHLLTRRLGLSIREGMLLTIGQVIDLQELEERRREQYPEEV